MLLAEDDLGNRILPSPERGGICPFCKSKVIPKCGEIKTWHWAHKSLKTCDSWGEPEGEWHYGWKKLAGLDNTEITIEKNGKRHRADIMINDLVIELQHSPLPTYEVREREQFYEKMTWVIDGGSIINILNNCYVKKSPTVLKSSPPPIERWISKNGNFYFRWTGRMRAWVNEISRDKWIHFNEVPVNTYYWHIDRLDYPRKNKKGEFTYEVYYKQREEQYNEYILNDILVNPKGKFCEILPKYEFAERYLGVKQKSLFDF